ncbi:hypothetical protein [Tenacibaculum sp. 1B UA]|nr:hypothetical protein [Tenacibaculum sp. 1B UA]
MKRQLVSFSILLFFVAQISNAQDDKAEKSNIQTYIHHLNF